MAGVWRHMEEKSALLWTELRSLWDEIVLIWCDIRNYSSDIKSVTLVWYAKDEIDNTLKKPALKILRIPAEWERGKRVKITRDEEQELFNSLFSLANQLKRSLRSDVER